MQPSAQTQQNCLHIAIVLRNDEHADIELFDGLAAFRFINKCFAGRGKRKWFATGQLERSTSWFFVLGAGLRAMLLAQWRSRPVDHCWSRGSDHSGKTILTLNALTKNMSDTCIYIHFQSCSQTQVSHS